jgi:class 3 adenylate cyclase
VGDKFCHECAAPVVAATQSAEYKQVTVLFADVVHSMDIAAAVGPERMREIMADLTDRCAAVVQRYGSTVAQFTGDGIMAVFGAPVALEDHAVRACLAALGIQQEAKRLAIDVRERDGLDLQLRVGLNSGEVTAGGLGSGQFGYAAVGEQVGMAQRMESVAPPGAVMLSASTARLVEGAATLGESELVQIKGAEDPVPARRLLQAPLTQTFWQGRRLWTTAVGDTKLGRATRIPKKEKYVPPSRRHHRKRIRRPERGQSAQTRPQRKRNRCHPDLEDDYSSVPATAVSGGDGDLV